jgi:hypothetical protein
VGAASVLSTGNAADGCVGDFDNSQPALSANQPWCRSVTTMSIPPSGRHRSGESGIDFWDLEGMRHA